MRKQHLDGLTEAYYQHYVTQTGSGMDVFRGGQHQYGDGLGSVLSAAARFLLPIAARTASRFVSSAARGIGSGSSLKDAAKEALLPTLDEAMTASSDQIHSRRRKRPAPQRVSKKPRLKVGVYKKLRTPKTKQKGRGIRKKRVYKGVRSGKGKRKSKKIRFLKSNF